MSAADITAQPWTVERRDNGPFRISGGPDMAELAQVWWEADAYLLGAAPALRDAAVAARELISITRNSLAEQMRDYGIRDANAETALTAYDNAVRRLTAAILSTIPPRAEATKPGVLVYGPQGCGKTSDARRIADALGLQHVADDWTGGDVPHDTLALTNDAAVLDRGAMTFALALRLVEGVRS